MCIGTTFLTLQASQDTVVVTLVRDGLASISAWMTVGLTVVLGALLFVLVLLIAELRKLSRTSSEFLADAADRSAPLIKYANRTARNLDHITGALRSEVSRLRDVLGDVSTGIDDASVSIRGRLGDLSALLDLAQSEAEDAILDAAAKIRTLRAGADLLRWGRSRNEDRSKERIAGEGFSDRLEQEPAGGGPPGPQDPPAQDPDPS